MRPWNLVARTTSSRRPFERLADDLLGLALGVDVGGVDDVDAGVEGAVDDRGCDSSWSGLPQAPNIIAPRVSGLTLTPVRPEGAVARHAVSSRCCGWRTGWRGGRARSGRAGWSRCTPCGTGRVARRIGTTCSTNDLEAAGQPRRHDVEAVGGTGLGPLLDRVGDLLRRAGDDAVAARAGEPVQQLADRRLFAVDDVERPAGSGCRSLRSSSARCSSRGNGSSRSYADRSTPVSRLAAGRASTPAG